MEHGMQKSCVRIKASLRLNGEIRKIITGRTPVRNVSITPALILCMRSAQTMNASIHKILRALQVSSLVMLLCEPVEMSPQSMMTPRIYTCFEVVGRDTFIVSCAENPHVISNTRSLDPDKTDIDSLCHQMGLNFYNHLNRVRRDMNLNSLTYDSSMYLILSHPHNLWQLEHRKISHSEGKYTLSQRIDYVGYKGVGECVALNFRFDETEESMFLSQYRSSPLHWKILTDSKYNRISISTLYDPEKRKFYSTVNVRR
jgi:uncharacterized protein YkwD